MTDKPRCWSYSPQGQRCDLFAGHEDDHSVATTWTDEEAWTPERERQMHPGPVPAYVDPALIPVEQLLDPGVDQDGPLPPCMNCDHVHVDVCTRMVKGAAGSEECGCPRPI